MTTPMTTERGQIGELVRYFLRLGCLGFGGRVARIGQMERELVDGRQWLTKEQMREAIAICQSLPGPLAIQVGIYVCYLRGGFWGAWAGGWAFILPNFIIVAALGALYVYLGDLQPVTAIFYGVNPAVIALFLHSCWLNQGKADRCCSEHSQSSHSDSSRSDASFRARVLSRMRRVIRLRACTDHKVFQRCPI